MLELLASEAKRVCPSGATARPHEPEVLTSAPAMRVSAPVIDTSKVLMELPQVR